MNCASCGASAIRGASKCYRCDRPFANAAPTARASRALPRTVAAAASVAFSLALLFVVDFAFLDDPPGVLLFAGVFAALGAALLRAWRGARAWTLGATAGSLLLAIVSLWGGALAGWLVLAASAGCIACLLSPSARAHFRAARAA